MRRTALVAVSTLLLPAVGVPCPSPAIQGAAGRTGLLTASDTVVAMVVGRVRSAQRLDQHGYRAQLVVEQALSGSLPTGSEVVMAWEELAAGRPPRLAEGDRILVALAHAPISVRALAWPSANRCLATLWIAALRAFPRTSPRC